VTNEELAAIVNIGLRVLSMRVLIILALVLDAALFSWAMYVGGWDRLAIAAAFAVLAWFTVHLRLEGSL
jgi:hypothetical protein